MLIYNLIVTTGFGGTFEGLLKIVWQLIKQFVRPWDELVGLIEAIYHGLEFVAEGPAAGHYTYDVTPAISFMRSVALKYL
jgi:hypothetical protein